MTIEEKESMRQECIKNRLISLSRRYAMRNIKGLTRMPKGSALFVRIFKERLGEKYKLA